MIDTSDKNFNINLNINIKNIRTRYQYQYQYCRIQNSISISIPIPKMMKFKLNLKTIPRYLDILRSQANTQKIRASIAQLCSVGSIRGRPYIKYTLREGWLVCRGVYLDILWWMGGFSSDLCTNYM